ncbi:MAG: NAD(P)/FAD-dependent oxidoreductase [Cyclobacteriaceae bacterium]
MKNVTVIGGGLAGLVTAIQLARAGVEVQLFEKRSYPHHRVCGEYISNETVPFLRSLDLFPGEFNPPNITQLQLTSVNGKEVILPLDLGGFGISRYGFDNWLFEKAKGAGVVVHCNQEIAEVRFDNGQFHLKSNEKVKATDVVVGAFGKRSRLDRTLQRSFIDKRSPYMGVKYHIKTDHPSSLISLHNFKDGYCGISNVEEGKSNLCYLSHRDNLKRTGSIEQMERQILFQNPFLKRIFEQSKFLFSAPETINEISFETKAPVHNHILMCGDSAGMITPLCGNGMAMAIHSSKVLADLLIPFCKNDNVSREKLEQTYRQKWTSLFAQRLWVGRQLQKLFGSTHASDFAVNLAKFGKPIAQYLVSKSHGKPF